MIHDSTIISPKAKIGDNVTIGPFSVVYDNVVIGDNSVIDGFCEIGYPSKLADGSPLTIGSDSLIRSHSIFYEGSSFGDKLTTGHRVTVREGTHAGLNLQIGTLSELQGDCKIGNYVRTQSNVFIGKASEIGSFVWLFPYVVLTNDPHPPSETLIGAKVKDYAIIAAMSVVLPGVTVNEHTLVGAHSLVNRDVPTGKVVGGNPAKIICKTSSIKLTDDKEMSAYPWPKHFHRGYPQAIVDAWNDEYAKENTE